MEDLRGALLLTMSTTSNPLRAIPLFHKLPIPCNFLASKRIMVDACVVYECGAVMRDGLEIDVASQVCYLSAFLHVHFYVSEVND
jgi:hypothetical protein